MLIALDVSLHITGGYLPPQIPLRLPTVLVCCINLEIANLLDVICFLKTIDTYFLAMNYRIQNVNL